MKRRRFLLPIIVFVAGFLLGWVLGLPGFPLQGLEGNISKANRYKSNVISAQSELITEKLQSDAKFADAYKQLTNSDQISLGVSSMAVSDVFRILADKAPFELSAVTTDVATMGALNIVFEKLGDKQDYESLSKRFDPIFDQATINLLQGVCNNLQPADKEVFHSQMAAKGDDLKSMIPVIANANSSIGSAVTNAINAVANGNFDYRF